MNRTYQIKPPRVMYFQMFYFLFLAIVQLLLALLLNKENTFIYILFLIISLASLIVVLISLVKIIRKNNLMEIEDDKLTINKLEVPIGSIEKIIIQGYFTQSLGIKLYGKKFIMNDLHFRFKDNEEMNVEDFKKWAEAKGIVITNGTIYKWL